MLRTHLLTFFLLFIAFMASAQAPSGYYDNAQGITGDELKDSLNNIISGHTEYPYSSSNTDVWDILKAADYDPDTTDNVILFYTGWSVDAAQEYNNGAGWTKEHIWAKQHGDFGITLGAGTDCHNLRPADGSTNSAKNNRWFDEAPDEYKDESGYVGSADSLTGNYWDDSDSLWIWEPRDEVKGDVARALFYMAVRYEGENGEPDLELVDTLPANNNTTEPIHAKLSTLLQWHNDDPVDDFERRRHDTVYNYQQNRNPFIDNPDWVCDIWGGTCTASATETFDNFTESTSYNTGTFTGVEDINWSYTKCKGTPTIEGNSAVMGKGYTPAANIKANTIRGGCGTLSFDYMQAYTTSVDFDVYVNGELIGTVDSSTQSVTMAASFTVNVIGDFSLELKQRNTSAGQVSIDNLKWTPYQTTTVETFANFSEGSSYNSSSFYGVDSVQWTYVSSKGNVTVDGNAATLGKGYTPAASMISDSISGGCGEISLTFQQPYSTTVDFDIYVNSTLIDNISTSTQYANTTTATYAVDEGGKYVIKVVQNNTSSGQVAIDNITWKSGGKAPEETGNVVETFDNCTVGGTYSDGNFVGENGNTWYWEESRDEYSYGIDGNGLMLRYITDSSQIYSNDIPNGIDTLEFDLKKAYTSSGDRQVRVFVNGDSITTTTGFDDTNTHHFTITGLTTTGDFDLKILNVTNYQVVIDNIYWTGYNAGSRGVANVENELNDKLRLYPNPTNGEVYVEFGKRVEDATVQVFNSVGTLEIQKSMVANKAILLNISHLSSGVYLVRVVSGDDAMMTKLIKR